MKYKDVANDFFKTIDELYPEATKKERILLAIGFRAGFNKCVETFLINKKDIEKHKEIDLKEPQDWSINTKKTDKPTVTKNTDDIDGYFNEHFKQCISSEMHKYEGKK